MAERHSDIQINVISNLQALKALEQDHNELVAHCGVTGIYSTFAYHYANAKTRHANSGWRYFAGRIDGQLAGCLYGFRVRRKLGPITVQAFTFCTELASEFLAYGEDRHVLVGKLIEAAVADQPDCILFGFDRVVPSCALDLEQSMRVSGLKYLSGWGGFGYRVDTRGSSRDFSRSLRRKTRQELERLGRRLNERTLTSFTFEAPLTKEENEKRLRQFIELEDSGWKGRRGTSIKRRSGERGYYEEIVRWSAKQQAMRWCLLSQEDKPVAMNLCILFNKTLAMPKVCYDEALARYSPGLLCTHQLILQCFDNEDIDQIDFITAPDWLAVWRPEKTEYRSVLVFGRSWKARLLYLVAAARRLFRKLIFGKAELERGRLHAFK